jgi:hypothetical protein
VTRRTWQMFAGPHGVIAVPADTERFARAVMARDHWSLKDPGYPLIGSASLQGLPFFTQGFPTCLPVQGGIATQPPTLRQQ